MPAAAQLEEITGVRQMQAVVTGVRQMRRGSEMWMLCQMRQGPEMWML